MGKMTEFKEFFTVSPQENQETQEHVILPQYVHLFQKKDWHSLVSCERRSSFAAMLLKVCVARPRNCELDCFQSSESESSSDLSTADL